MCYNYETLIRKGIKRSIRDKGYEETIASLSETEKRIWEEKSKRLLDDLDSEASINEEVEKQSTFPGALVQVIPIDSKQREDYQFGFIPYWSKSLKDQNINFNARADSIRVKPTWKTAWKSNQRCLVCAAGFYETDRQTKKRYFFSVKDRHEIFFAGIFNHWKNPENNQIIKTFAIITTEPNSLVEPVHNRMPVILDKEGEIIWLKPNASEETVFNLLRPYPSELMDMKEAPKPPRKKKGGSELTLEF
jgi:putative SOS response-associated peptidase YedK